MAKKKRPLDMLTLYSIAAQREGLSYGHYMSKYNYNPPDVAELEEEILADDKKREDGGKLIRREVPKEKPRKQCPECGKWFTQTHRNQVCCTEGCQYERKKRKEREPYEKGKEQRYCEICGKPLPLSVSRRVFTCSKACSAERDRIRVRKWNQKKRQEVH